MNYLTLYCETLGVCIIMLLILFCYNIRKWKPKIINPLSLVYIFTMITAFIDIVWRIIDGKPQFRYLNLAINGIYLCMFILLPFCWLEHCDLNMPFRLWKKKSLKFITQLPSIIVIVLIIISFKTGWVYYVDKNGVYSRGNLYLAQAVTCYAYILFAEITSVIAIKKSKFTAERQKYTTLAAFPVPVAVFCAVQSFMPVGMPTIHFGVLIGLFFVFVSDSEHQITRDSLTRLMNRYSMDCVIKEKTSKYRKSGGKQSLYLILGDLDDFKKINDTYGHMEGDKALQITATGIDNLCNEYEATPFRMGGDEFAIIMESEDSDKVRFLIEQISYMLKESSEGECFNLRMSMGFSAFSSDMEIIDFINSADKQLYIVKSNNKKRAPIIKEIL